MIRILASIPVILTGKVITDIGYRIAGATHHNPFNRRRSS